MHDTPMSEVEALAWLRAQPGGRIIATDAELGRRWDWNRQRVGRRLKAWAKAGRIKRRGDAVTVVEHETVTGTLDVTSTVTIPATDPRTRGVTTSVTDHALVPAPSRFPKRAALSSVPEAVTRATARAAAAAAAISSQPPPAAESGVTVLPPRRRIPFLAIALAGLALGIWAVGIAINSWFAASLGKTAEAAWLFIAIGVTADGLAFLLPTTAFRLAHARRYFGAMVAWLLWTATMAFALLASAGFAGLNVSDVTAARARDALAGQALAARIATLRTERSAITETRSVPALEAELQAAQPSAAAVWKQTDGCRDVTKIASGQACAAVLQARQRLAEAQRRDAIDAELRDAERRIASSAAITSADPQAVTFAKLINWSTLGLTNISTNDVAMLRVALITLLPQCAGLVLMLAMGLAQPARGGCR